MSTQAFRGALVLNEALRSVSRDPLHRTALRALLPKHLSAPTSAS